MPGRRVETLSSLCSPWSQGCCAWRGILQLLSRCRYQPAFLQWQHPPALACVTDCLVKNKLGSVKLRPLLCSVCWAGGAGRDASLLPARVTWGNRLSGRPEAVCWLGSDTCDRWTGAVWVSEGRQPGATHHPRKRVRQKTATHLRNPGPDWSNMQLILAAKLFL